MVSAPDWHAGSLGLIPGRSRPDIFGLNSNGQRLTLLNCAAGRAVLYTPCKLIGMPRSLHKNFPNVAQAAVGYHNTTVVLCVDLMAKYASASTDIERKKMKTGKKRFPSSIRSPMLPS